MRFGPRLWMLTLLVIGVGVLTFGIYQANTNSRSTSTFTHGSNYTSNKIAVKGAQTEANSVKDVIDGDTLALTDGRRVRLIGINAPEKDQPFYTNAKEKLKNFISGQSVNLSYDVEKKDKYGRDLAYVYVGNLFVNLELVKSGIAVIETIPPNVAHADEFVAAANSARANCLGIWEGLCYQDSSACVQISSIQAKEGSGGLNNEWVEFMNTCSTNLNLSGYLVKDSSASNHYTFKDVSISSKQKVKLHSGCGTDSASDIFWACPPRTVPVWNNSGDHAYLFDARGKLVSEIGY